MDHNSETIVEEDDNNDDLGIAGPSPLDTQALLLEIQQIRTSSKSSLLEQNKFALTSSKPLLESWVAQPSPCCAAASVAGALNVLLPHPDARRWTWMDVLPYYIAMTDERVEAQKQLLLQWLTVAQLAILETRIWSQLRTQHEIILGDTSRGRSKLTKSILLKAVETFCYAHQEADEMKELVALLLSNIIMPVDNTLDETLNLEFEVASPVAVTFTIASVNNEDLRKRRRQALYQYFHLLDGRGKLAHPHRPSTAICGNSALLYVIDHFRTAPDLQVHGNEASFNTLQASLFIGRSTSSAALKADTPSEYPSYCQISSEDDNGRRTQIWRYVWTAFTQKRTGSY